MTERAVSASSAQQHADGEQLVGTWKLVSCFMEDIKTKKRSEPWGERPNGFLTLTAGGRWIVVQTAEGRKAPQTDSDRAVAFRSMLAYCGRYHLDGQKITINVDIAWDEAWTGTEQTRFFRLEDGRLHIEAAPQRYSNLGDNIVRAVLIWQRVE